MPGQGGHHVDPWLTKDRDTARNTATVQGMAHFAGSGPSGTTCGQCQFWVHIKDNHTRCEKYRELMREYGACDIPSHTKACKYFVQAKRNAKK